MERGYVKLWRAIDQNELLENDNTALVVFIKLLTRVDRHTGSFRTGRFKLANMCNMKPSTVRDALKRLEAATIVRQQSDSRATTIYICNWDKYQQPDDSTPSRRRRTDDTKQEKKENIDTNVSMAKTRTPRADIDEMFIYWQQKVGYEIVGQTQKNRFACSNLLKKHGKEKLMRLIDGVDLASQDKFSGIKIADFQQLQQRQNDLIAWGRKTTTNARPKGAIIR